MQRGHRPEDKVQMSKAAQVKFSLHAATCESAHAKACMELTFQG